ncbi:DUF1127 domain-containing protein [Rhodovulum strictum]|uniref:DUF1127 domain-containing protein n=1 Tax=Rhodovulum strictum TaxID=58314 RepID=A0A844B155_9RHOB|nr:DUF1127 domain-containing protein [Rhodovulum strictum]MRH20106.1 DUF1127 domain-containing protein [Rhodovulum strictum]
MASFHDDSPHAGRWPAAHGLHRLIAGLFGRLAARIDARRTRNELWRLTDRELDDIGLSRADIDRITR